MRGAFRFALAGALAGLAAYSVPPARCEAQQAAGRPFAGGGCYFGRDGSRPVPRCPRWPTWIPFGIGQFHNGRPGLGATFATVEVILLATSVTTFWVHRSMRDDGMRTLAETDRIRAVDKERRLRLTNWISTGVLGAAVIAGVVEAQLAFEPARRGEPTAVRWTGTGLQARF